MKRSNAPIFWLLFGAGGMLSALLGTALVLIDVEANLIVDILFNALPVRARMRTWET
jgi:fumarate reductase subunit D